MRNFILAIMIILLPGLSHNAISGQYNAVLSIGDPMPAFSNLPNITGNTLSTDKLTESVLVFVSLANHCPWVRGMDKDLIHLVDQFENHDVRIIGISMNRRKDDQLPAMQEHAKKVGYNFDYVYDDSQQFGRALGATRTPEYFVFNQDRKLAYMGLLHNSPGKISKNGEVKYINGPPSEFYAKNAIEGTLQDKPFSPTETRAHGCTIKYVQ